MKERLYNEEYETPQVEVFTVESEGLFCDSPGNGGIEGGYPDEI